uniref:PPPDE domain-containing protein n=1 Tax=Chromera velia CCMP2878 TaxID=1169474 RepID=A0A0G4IA75_9ALVE|eukprot:Cvel_12376.t1-p1 / transcript=Cvel_12376.t1 / gene=Cvel_12376 / organism=Chromera_velia_CCMP2878 / gene_product=hypothetical protein / transcript_product=hypothetical protein / location=Cvel_scaffold808:19962-21230(+) / protein_length=423 / sequence_SO=supercontig / SO=protein_coding / is_pseudo=false
MQGQSDSPAGSPSENSAPPARGQYAQSCLEHLQMLKRQFERDYPFLVAGGTRRRTVEYVLRDISNGWVPSISHALMGYNIEFVPHSSVIIDRRWEIQFLGGIVATDLPTHGFDSATAIRRVPMGTTTLTDLEICELLFLEYDQWTVESYRLRTRNCNHFTKRVLELVVQDPQEREAIETNEDVNRHEREMQRAEESPRGRFFLAWYARLRALWENAVAAWAWAERVCRPAYANFCARVQELADRVRGSPSVQSFQQRVAQLWRVYVVEPLRAVAGWEVWGQIGSSFRSAWDSFIAWEGWRMAWESANRWPPVVALRERLSWTPNAQQASEFPGRAYIANAGTVGEMYLTVREELYTKADLVDRFAQRRHRQRANVGVQRETARGVWTSSSAGSGRGRSATWDGSPTTLRGGGGGGGVGFRMRA